MKRTIRLFLVIALALAVFGQYTAASAAEVIQTKGLSAYTFFNYSDGCAQTYIFVQGMDRLYKTPPGPGEATSTVHLYFQQIDSCTNQFLWGNGTFPVDKEELVVDKKLGWTTLDTTVTLGVWKIVGSTVTQSNLEVDLDLTWTATGPLIPTRYEYNDNTPHCNWISRYKGLAREAEVAGTITLDGATWTADPSWYAQIFSFKAGELTIGCE